MIDVRCTLPDTLTIQSLKEFQGNLKTRTPEDLKELADSLSTEGLIMPFVVWNNSGEMKLLDGHGRLEALRLLSAKDSDITEQEFPVLFIEAETEDEAKKLLLQITSSYGKITKKGALNFCKSITDYHAPSINKFVHKPVVKRKFDTPKTETIIRIAVPVDKVDQLKQVLGNVSFIRVL